MMPRGVIRSAGRSEGHPACFKSGDRVLAITIFESCAGAARNEVRPIGCHPAVSCAGAARNEGPPSDSRMSFTRQKFRDAHFRPCAAEDIKHTGPPVCSSGVAERSHLQRLEAFHFVSPARPSRRISSGIVRRSVRLA